MIVFVLLFGLLAYAGIHQKIDDNRPQHGQTEQVEQSKETK